MSYNPLKFAYFGGEPIGAPILERLLSADLVPQLVVCGKDKPVGRKQIITPSPVKVIAERNSIPIFQPSSYRDGLAEAKLREIDWDTFVVVAYNFILPRWMIELPRYKTVNVHPSLLPKLRGASPIRSAILRDVPEAVGVSVILLDEKMDHGPILAQKPYRIMNEDWPMSGQILDAKLARLGGDLLIETLPEWVNGKITPQEQNHEWATYCERFITDDSELVIDPFALPDGPAGRQAWLKINAFAGVGETFFKYDGKRVKVTKANMADGQLHLDHVIPEGKKEMPFETYLSTLKK